MTNTKHCDRCGNPDCPRVSADPYFRRCQAVSHAADHRTGGAVVRRPPHVWVSEIHSERDWQMMTLPMPEARFHVRALVMYGRRQYLVTDFGERGVTVTSRYALPSERPMRRCPRRDRIVAAVRSHRSYSTLSATPRIIGQAVRS